MDYYSIQKPAGAITVANFTDDYGNYISPYILSSYIARYEFFNDTQGTH